MDRDHRLWFRSQLDGSRRPQSQLVSVSAASSREETRCGLRNLRAPPTPEPRKQVVSIYFSRLGAPLYAHERSTLAAVAQAIAQIKGCDFAPYNDDPPEPLDRFLVPDDTLILDEAMGLGIRCQRDFFGGVVPYPFVKTKAITHPLIDNMAEHPEGWSSAFTGRVRHAVLPGYTVFSARDAQIAATLLLAHGAIRVKEPLASGGRGQTPINTVTEFNTFLENFSRDALAAYGLVLELNLRRVTTLSVGQITVEGQTVTYHGTQRSVTDNEGRSVYGGSDLVCVRGGWDALDRLALSTDERLGIRQARAYDEAMRAYPAFIASRRNYDVGQGIDSDARWRSGVFESSWRAGGASSAELAAVAAFVRDPGMRIVEASAVKEFGKDHQAPRGAVIQFQGDDPQDGPVIRYSCITRTIR